MQTRCGVAGKQASALRLVKVVCVGAMAVQVQPKGWGAVVSEKVVFQSSKRSARTFAERTPALIRSAIIRLIITGDPQI